MENMSVLGDDDNFSTHSSYLNGREGKWEKDTKKLVNIHESISSVVMHPKAYSVQGTVGN